MNIFKYKLVYGLSLPLGTQFLDVQMQDDNITIWTLEPEDEYPNDRTILVCFTGEQQDIHTYDIYLGTVQHDEYDQEEAWMCYL